MNNENQLEAVIDGTPGRYRFAPADDGDVALEGFQFIARQVVEICVARGYACNEHVSSTHGAGLVDLVLVTI